MKRKSCFLIGHRDTGEEIYPLLAAEVERHITEFGVQDFFVGHYGAFDSMAGRAVIQAKRRHPDICLMMLLPYHPSVRKVELPSGFDGTFFPEGQESVPARAAIVRANTYMLQTTDHLICYVRYPSSGSREILELALKRQRKGLMRVTNLSGWLPE